MFTTLEKTEDLDEMRHENSRAVNNLRLLYLSLNDVVAFAREVLANDNYYIRPGQSRTSVEDVSLTLLS